MTLDKKGIRQMVDEWLSDYGVNHRFEISIDDNCKNCFLIEAQRAKKRVPHPTQDRFKYDIFNNKAVWRTCQKGFGEDEL